MSSCDTKRELLSQYGHVLEVMQEMLSDAEPGHYNIFPDCNDLDWWESVEVIELGCGTRQAELDIGECSFFINLETGDIVCVQEED